MTTTRFVIISGILLAIDLVFFAWSVIAPSFESLLLSILSLTISLLLVIVVGVMTGREIDKS